MNNTKRFFRQIIYTEDLNDNTIRGLLKILFKRILSDFEVIYDSFEFKLQTILEPESEKNLIFKQNKFPTFASIIQALGTRQKNKFYPANPSLWVVFISCFLGILIIIFVSILHSQDFVTVVYKQFGISIIGFILCLIFWVSLFYKEKVYGYHTDLIRNNITLSFWVFLFTEGLCFMSLFWTFFHSLLAASTHIGQFAPGDGIVNYYFDENVVMHPYWSTFIYTDISNAEVHNFSDDIVDKYTYDHTLAVKFHFNLFDCGQLIDPYGYPALNTALLLISATILNAGHTKLKIGKYLKSFLYLALTLLFGLVFMCVQFLEIKNCTLQYNDGIYACSFYSLTGLHGIHVILGVFALFLCFINFIKGNYTRKRHDTFWCAVAYWHFVDVVWVLVYLLIYCWPSCLYFSDDIRYSYLGYKDYCFNINTEVFEEKFFEKIVNNDFKLISEIISFYNSEILAELEKALFLKASLKSSEDLVRNRSTSLTANYSPKPLLVNVPLLTSDELEENEYSGFGNKFQDEFCSKTLRQNETYKTFVKEAIRKKLIIDLSGSEEGWNLYLEEEKEKWLKNKKKVELKPILLYKYFESHLSKVKPEIEKGLLLAFTLADQENSPYSSRYKGLHWNTNDKDIDEMMFAMKSVNRYNYEQRFWELQKLKTSHIQFNWDESLPSDFGNEIWQHRYFFTDKVFAVLGNPDPNIVSPKLTRVDFSNKDLKERIFFIKQLHQAFHDPEQLSKVMHPDYVSAINKVLVKNEFFDDVFHSRNNKKLNIHLTSDFPVVKSFLQNKYYLPYMKPKNNVGLEEQVFLMLDLYNMHGKRKSVRKYGVQESLQSFLKSTDLKGDAFIAEYLVQYVKRLHYLGLSAKSVVIPVDETDTKHKLFGFKTASSVLGVQNSNETTPRQADIAFRAWKKNFGYTQNFLMPRPKRNFLDIHKSFINNFSNKITKEDFVLTHDMILEAIKLFNNTKGHNYNVSNTRFRVLQKNSFPLVFVNRFSPQNILKIDYDLNKQTSKNLIGFGYDIIASIKSKDEQILYDKMEKLFATGSLLNDLSFFDEKDYFDDRIRRRDCLAMVAIEEQPKTLSQALAKEGRRTAASQALANRDLIYSKIKASDKIFLNKQFLGAKNCTLYLKSEIAGDVQCFLTEILVWPPLKREPFLASYIGLLLNLSSFGYDMPIKDADKFKNIRIPMVVFLGSKIRDAHIYFSNIIDNIIIEKENNYNRIINLKKNEVNIHLAYFEMYETREYMNYSELKNDKHLYAASLNILHTISFDYLYFWAVSDLTTWKGKIKFFILFMLYQININWAFTFAAKFTPYFLTSDFKCIWGDLLYTSKPKWTLKKN